MHSTERKIILGSSSKMRKLILESAWISFRTISPDIDELAYEHLSPIKKIKKIALEKNKKISSLIPEDDIIIITADTLCLLPSGKTLGKPNSQEELIEMCMMQSNQTIKAVTAISISFFENNSRKYITKHSITEITYLPFTESDIEYLLKKNKNQWIASWLGTYSDSIWFTLIKKWKGSYTGALWLPMEIIREIFNQIQ